MPERAVRISSEVCFWLMIYSRRTMYVVTEIFSCVGVILSTSVKISKAGKNVVAPNGEIKADMDTRNTIHIFAPDPQIV